MASDKEVLDVKILCMVAVLLSTPVLGMWIWLVKKSHAILNFLPWTIIAIASCLVLLSLLGYWLVFKEKERRDTCWLWRKPDKNPWKWRCYVILVNELLTLLMAFTVFAFVVIHDGGGNAVPDKAFLELQGSVSKSSTWDKITHSLIRSKVCDSLPSTLDAFNLAKLSPEESGCCKPPTTCGFSFVTSTNWTKHTTNSNDPDCGKWRNGKSNLCFGCNSCKAGVLENVRVHWRKVSIGNTIVFILITIVNSIGYYMY